MRYFYVLGQYGVPERFHKIKEINESDVEAYKLKEGYIKKLTQEQALEDGLLRKHFSREEIEESYDNANI